MVLLPASIDIENTDVYADAEWQRYGFLSLSGIPFSNSKPGIPFLIKSKYGTNRFLMQQNGCKHTLDPVTKEFLEAGPSGKGVMLQGAQTWGSLHRATAHSIKPLRSSFR